MHGNPSIVPQPASTDASPSLQKVQNLLVQNNVVHRGHPDLVNDQRDVRQLRDDSAVEDIRHLAQRVLLGICRRNSQKVTAKQ